MNAPDSLESHFAVHWLPWLALYHFLPAPNLRAVASSMVAAMSRGELTLDDLFEEQSIDAHLVSEVWVVRPKPVTSPLASYLQTRIRYLVWNNDGAAFVDPNADWSDLPVHPSLIEVVVSFATRPGADFLSRARASHEPAKHPALTVLAQCMEALSQPASADDVSHYANTIEASIAQFELPLRAAALKFAGDCAAAEDQWREAEMLYRRVLLRLSEFENAAPVPLVTGLTTVTVQSLATASRVLRGKQSAAEIFDEVSERWPGVDPTLFAANASHESLVVHTREDHWPSDHRTHLLCAPLLIDTHHVERPLIDFLGSNFMSARKGFVSHLRRQIALGSSAETSMTKAVYARSLIASLTTEHDKRRDKATFSAAICFLIDSGAPNLASGINWSKDLVDFYVDDEMIQSVQNRAAAFDGVRTERQMVAVEIFLGWAMQLSPDASGIGVSILQRLAQFAMTNTATLNSGTNIVVASLKAIEKIGGYQCAWCRPVSQPVAGAVVARLNTPGWWTGMQVAAETAMTYVDAFAEDDLTSVVKAAVDALEKSDPGAWVVIRPLEDFITSERASVLIRADQSLERRVVGLLLRQETAEGSDRAHLIHYLRTFDANRLDDPELKCRLQEVIEDIKKSAASVSSSAAPANIQALLGAAKLSGLQGVKVALDSLGTILESAGAAHRNISLPVAYYPLLQLAVEYDRIAAALCIPREEFLRMLTPLGDLLIKLWKKAADDPTLFVSPSFPPQQVPDSVVVHNWTFVSLRFARLLGEVEAIESAIDGAAEAGPSIAKAIMRAKTIQELSSGEDTFDEAKVKNDGNDAFYLNIGSRLSQVDVSTDEGRGRCRLLLSMCLQHGPNDLDLAILSLAQQCGLTIEDSQGATVATYMARLKANREMNLIFLPLLNQLGYKPK